MCVNCIQLQVDVTEGIPKSLNLQFCRSCERYLQPPAAWLYCELESRELLALCLKKLKGLSKVRLIDAGFIWTEPHSRRIKVSLTIQKEVFAATILQQKFEVEYTIGNMQCPDCTKIMAKNLWKATVQVRQKVEHQRTFLYLEQLIIKHNMHLETTNIKVVKGGLDFQYANRSQAIKMVDFLQNVVPVRSKTSEQLISHDIHTSVSNYKFTYSVEIVPTCKDDLICVSKKMANALGQISQMVLCTRVGGVIKVIDFTNLQAADISSDVYWRGDEIGTVLSSNSLKEFYVIDVEPVQSNKTLGKFALADITVQRLSDVGKNNNEYIVRSHLGNLLNYGDTVLGYDLEISNINNKFFERLSSEKIPSIVLVKKSYSEKKRKRKQRNWKLKSLTKDEGELQAKKQAQKKIDDDYELFLRDLEEDPELRQNINLYKSDNPHRQADSIEADGGYIVSDGESELDDEDLPEVPLEELLDGLNLNENDGQEVEIDDEY
ncbi:60S ribosomal export protein NMD3 [Smittium culicis]|uniref:60S ribosomal export protein NMD3 n=1 Tax=Smittium culicis TaxID=133412 RepID=A0A1R1X3M2_9FUNG|nr:60S ribosomal export protein NMD3 [Smittium culicis]